MTSDAKNLYHCTGGPDVAVYFAQAPTPWQAATIYLDRIEDEVLARHPGAREVSLSFRVEPVGDPDISSWRFFTARWIDGLRGVHESPITTP